MGCIDTHATLRIFSFSVSVVPGEITELLDIEPTTIVERDENYKYLHQRQQRFMSWITQLKLESMDNMNHVNKIISVFGGKANELQCLRERGCITNMFSF